MLQREQGSTPLVGSSRTTVPDAPMKAMPMASFLFMPPESTRVCLCRCSVNSTSRRVLKQERSPHSSPSTPRCSTSQLHCGRHPTNEDEQGGGLEASCAPESGRGGTGLPEAPGKSRPTGPMRGPPSRGPPSTVFRRYLSPLRTRYLSSCHRALCRGDGISTRVCTAGVRRSKAEVPLHHAPQGGPGKASGSGPPGPTSVSTCLPDSGVGKFPCNATS